MDWFLRPVVSLLSAEHLADLLEHTRLRSGQAPFTTAAAAGLDEVAQWQRLEDLAWCGRVQALVVLVEQAGAAEVEFVRDEVALALGVQVDLQPPDRNQQPPQAVRRGGSSSSPMPRMPA